MGNWQITCTHCLGSESSSQRSCTHMHECWVSCVTAVTFQHQVPWGGQLLFMMRSCITWTPKNILCRHSQTTDWLAARTHHSGSSGVEQDWVALAWQYTWRLGQSTDKTANDEGYWKPLLGSKLSTVENNTIETQQWWDVLKIWGSLNYLACTMRKKLDSTLTMHMQAFNISEFCGPCPSNSAEGHWF